MPHVVLVASFATNVTYLGNIWYLNSTSYLFWTIYHPPSARQCAPWQSEAVMVVLIFDKASMSPHFCLTSNSDLFVMLVSPFAPDITHLGSIWHPASTSHMFFYHLPRTLWPSVHYMSGRTSCHYLIALFRKSWDTVSLKDCVVVVGVWVMKKKNSAYEKSCILSKKSRASREI